MSVSPARLAFVASRAAVAAPNHLAAAAGLRILAAGGNAVDAMVATNATLGVVYPHMTGPGGDNFWLIYDAKRGRTYALNASGRAAAGATRERFLGYGASIEPRGPLAALTVPGAVDGWAQAHTRFGRLPFRDCLAPAIAYAREGFPVSRGQARWTRSHRELLSSFPSTAVVFLKPDGAAYLVAEPFRNPRLADTLQAIAEGGREAFYQGPIARAVGEFLAQQGGVLTAEDFAAHTSDWLEPVEAQYRGRKALNVPPNSQGFSALQILGILEHFDVAALADDPVGYVDLLVGATRLAFEDRDRYLTDPAFESIPLDRLLSPDYLAGRARLLRTRPGATLPPARPVGGDTTFSCCVDAEGNAVGVIQSIYFEWGSGVVAGETGLLLQNRGSFFSLLDDHPNRLEPGKRTFHTLTAAMLLAPDGRPELVYGTMGGEGQPQTQAAIATRVIDFGLDVQEAVDAPRWVYGRTWGQDHHGLRLEARFGEAVAEALGARGHENVSLVGDWDDLMGHAQAIQIFPNRLEVAADPRGDGAAFGF
jgi:gamma-glutamyltranspeptidase/glutathione hydrolase